MIGFRLDALRLTGEPDERLTNGSQLRFEGGA
jgi:hypothetical protein